MTENSPGLSRQLCRAGSYPGSQIAFSTSPSPPFTEGRVGERRPNTRDHGRLQSPFSTGLRSGLLLLLQAPDVASGTFLASNFALTQLLRTCLCKTSPSSASSTVTRAQRHPLTAFAWLLEWHRQCHAALRSASGWRSHLTSTIATTMTTPGWARALSDRLPQRRPSRSFGSLRRRSHLADFESSLRLQQMIDFFETVRP